MLSLCRFAIEVHTANLVRHMPDARAPDACAGECVGVRSGPREQHARDIATVGRSAALPRFAARGQLRQAHTTSLRKFFFFFAHSLSHWVHTQRGRHAHTDVIPVWGHPHAHWWARPSWGTIRSVHFGTSLPVWDTLWAVYFEAFLGSLRLGISGLQWDLGWGILDPLWDIFLCLSLDTLALPMPYCHTCCVQIILYTCILWVLLLFYCSLVLLEWLSRLRDYSVPLSTALLSSFSMSMQFTPV